jgi:hypothetical protein
MNQPNYPTPWQRKTLWTGATFFAAVLIGAIVVGLIWLASQVLGFLQPILIPFAVAGVAAFLLDPVVSKIESWGTTRTRAVIAVFAVVALTLTGILLWIVPALVHQTDNVVRKVPAYTLRLKTVVLDFARQVEVKTGFKMPVLDTVEQQKAEMGDVKKAESIAEDPKKAEAEKPEELAPPPKARATDATTTAAAREKELEFDWQQIVSGRWVQTTLPLVLRNSWTFVTRSVGGFLGVFGFCSR